MYMLLLYFVYSQSLQQLRNGKVYNFFFSLSPTFTCMISEASPLAKVQTPWFFRVYDVSEHFCVGQEWVYNIGSVGLGVRHNKIFHVMISNIRVKGKAIFCSKVLCFVFPLPRSKLVLKKDFFFFSVQHQVASLPGHRIYSVVFPRFYLTYLQTRYYYFHLFQLPLIE